MEHQRYESTTDTLQSYNTVCCATLLLHDYMPNDKTDNSVIPAPAVLLSQNNIMIRIYIVT